MDSGALTKTHQRMIYYQSEFCPCGPVPTYSEVGQS